MKLLPIFRGSSLSTLYSGSGREIPAMCYGAGYGMAILPRSPSTTNGQSPGFDFILRIGDALPGTSPARVMCAGAF